MDDKYDSQKTAELLSLADRVAAGEHRALLPLDSIMAGVLTDVSNQLRAAQGEISRLSKDAESWRKLGLVYEDDLPVDIPDQLYNLWYEESQLINGVRMGPRLAAIQAAKGNG